MKRFFIKDDASLLDAKQLPRINRLLDRLDSAVELDDMNLPGYRLHELSGKRKGTWSVTVSGNWRITFQFKNEHVYNVDLEDYH